jgi:predicted DNA-binding protein (UPF0251 family)
MDLTRAQADALDALVRFGSQKEAAAALGISLRALKRRLQAARDRNGGMTNVQLAYWWRRTVWDTAA